MRHVLSVVALVGLALIVAGVFVLVGEGWALIAAGLALVALVVDWRAGE